MAAPKNKPAAPRDKASIAFGKRLRDVRVNKRCETRPQLAAVVSVDASTIYRWEQGQGGPDGAQLAKLLRHYAEHRDVLLELEPSPALIEFLRTPLGVEAERCGMRPMLASIEFKYPSVESYRKITLAFIDDYKPRR